MKYTTYVKKIGVNLFAEATNRVERAREILANEENFDSEKISNLAKDIVQIFESGKKIAFVGNGGSAAEAMHLAAEFTGKCVIDHVPFPVMCLNESQSALTAIANDYGVDYMFSRQVEAHLQEGDLLIALSTSGKSRNIVHALEVCKLKRVRGIIWMGNYDFEIQNIESWKVQSKQTPRIQEIHLLWGHILSELIELLV